MPQPQIPAAYVESGSGPGNLVARDAEGEIPNQPVIFKRGLSQEVADLLRLQLPSGFTRPVVLQPTTEGPTVVPNRFYLDASAGLEAIVDGFRLQLPKALIPVDATIAPTTGSRVDVAFLEAYFVRSGNGRALQYRIRVVQDVTELGFGLEGVVDPNVFAMSASGVLSNITFAKQPAYFPYELDAGVYVAMLPGSSQDYVSIQGTDSNYYEVIYALPICYILRLNSTPYNALTNPNGAGAGNSGISGRPDGLFHDYLTPSYHLDASSHQVSLVRSAEEIFNAGVVAVLKNQLSTVQELSLENLSGVPADGTLRSYFNNADGVQKLVLNTNVIRNSHFRVDTDANGIANGWVLHQAGLAGGTPSMAIGGGQRVSRSAVDSGNPYGVKQLVNNVSSKKLRIQMNASLLTAGANTRLKLEIYDTDAAAVAHSWDLGEINSLTSGLKVRHAALADYVRNFEVRVYLDGGSGEVLVSYVDVAPSWQSRPVMEVDDGLVYKVILDSYLTSVGAQWETAATLWNAVTGSQLTGALLVSTTNQPNDTLTYSLNTVPPHSNLRLNVGLDYPDGEGFGRPISQALGAQDSQGFVAVIESGQTDLVLTAEQVGQPLLANEFVKVHNPSSSVLGVTVNVRLLGNGTATVAVPATRYGRRLLLANAVKVSGSPVAVSNAIKNVDGSTTLTLGSAVSSGTPIDIEMVSDAPLVVWDLAGNGVSGIYAAQFAESKLLTQNTTVYVPSDYRIEQAIDLVVTRPIIRNDQVLTLSDGSGLVAATQGFVRVVSSFFWEAGDVAQVLVLKNVSAEALQATTFSFLSNVVATTTVGGTDPLRLAYGPLLIAHTKGAGGVDSNSGFGPLPFLNDATLTATPISRSGELADNCVLFGLEKIFNSVAEAPVLVGRVFQANQLTGRIAEGVRLEQSVPHASELFALVVYAGTYLLMRCTTLRSDNRTLVQDPVVTFYELPGRPLASG